MIENLLVCSRMFAVKHTYWRNLIKLAKSPNKTQEKVLQRILSNNRNTQYGKQHHFDEITHYKQFSKSVPVVTYETLRPFVEEQLQSGLPALTASAPVLYATTSGTTGKAKYVPIIRDELERQKRHTALLTYSQYVYDPLAFSGKIWVMAAAAVEGRFENGIPWGSASGFLYASMSPAIANKYLIPPVVFSIEDNELKYALILRLSLVEKSITYFSAANPTTLLRICKLANQQWNAQVEDIERGGFSRMSELSPEVIRSLQGRLVSNVARADELRKMFNAGHVVTFSDMWPNLRMVSTWTGGNCSVAIGKSKKLLSKEVKIVELGYLSSEFCGSLTVDCNLSSGLPSIADYFYEFIEPDRWDAGVREFRLVHELEDGREYYVVITTPSGLYRYFINDIIRVEGAFYNTPQISFVQKGKGVTNITGEKLYESQLTTALNDAEVTLFFQTNFHLMLADVEQQVYRLYIEADNLPQDIEKVVSCIENRLIHLNSEYRAKRESGRLQLLEIVVLESGTGEQYRASCIQAGQKDGQFKMLTLQYVHQCQFEFNSCSEAADSP